MLLFGDLIFPRKVEPNEPFGLIEDVLKREDLVFGNLEGCLYDEGDASGHRFYPILKAPHNHPSGALALVAGHFAAVGLANNLVRDEEPIRRTISILDELGISYTGAGMNLQEARAPAILERNGARIGLLQRTSIFQPIYHRAVPKGPYRVPDEPRYLHGVIVPGEVIELRGEAGVATIKARTSYEPTSHSILSGGGDPYIHTWPDPNELNEFIEDVKQLRPRVDILVTAHHWRLTGAEIVRDYRVEIAHAAIDAGADLVVGHGTHRMDDGIEIYQDKAIVYGLGNLTNPTRRTESEGKAVWGPKGYGFEKPQYHLGVKAEIKSGKIARVSCLLVGEGGPQDSRPAFLRPAEQPEQVETLIELSRRFGTSLKVTDDEVVALG